MWVAVRQQYFCGQSQTAELMLQLKASKIMFLFAFIFCMTIQIYCRANSAYRLPIGKLQKGSNNVCENLWDLQNSDESEGRRCLPAHNASGHTHQRLVISQPQLCCCNSPMGNVVCPNNLQSVTHSIDITMNLLFFWIHF